MPRELRVSATLPLPENPFDEAELVVESKPMIDAFFQRMEELGGTASYSVLTPKPRGGSDDAVEEKASSTTGANLPLRGARRPPPAPAASDDAAERAARPTYDISIPPNPPEAA